MCDKNGVLALTANLSKFHSDNGGGIKYLDSLSNKDNSELHYKRSNSSKGQRNQDTYGSCSSNMVPHDKNNLDLVKRFVYGMCQEYLGGIWKRIDIKDFEISKPK